MLVCTVFVAHHHSGILNPPAVYHCSCIDAVKMVMTLPVLLLIGVLLELLRSLWVPCYWTTTGTLWVLMQMCAL